MSFRFICFFILSRKKFGTLHLGRGDIDRNEQSFFKQWLESLFMNSFCRNLKRHVATLSETGSFDTASKNWPWLCKKKFRRQVGMKSMKYCRSVDNSLNQILNVQTRFCCPVKVFRRRSGYKIAISFDHHWCAFIIRHAVFDNIINTVCLWCHRIHLVVVHSCQSCAGFLPI